MQDQFFDYMMAEAIKQDIRVLIENKAKFLLVSCAQQWVALANGIGMQLLSNEKDQDTLIEQSFCKSYENKANCSTKFNIVLFIVYFNATENQNSLIIFEV